MEDSVEQLAEVLAAIGEADSVLFTHNPGNCTACAEALLSYHHLVCGGRAAWSARLDQLLDEAQRYVTSWLHTPPDAPDVDEERMMRVAAKALDAYGEFLDHTCPECDAGSWCPGAVRMRARAREAIRPALRQVRRRAYLAAES